MSKTIKMYCLFKISTILVVNKVSFFSVVNKLSKLVTIILIEMRIIATSNLPKCLFIRILIERKMQRE